MSRSESARQSNERIAEKAARFRFVSRVPMLCECSDPTCQQIFLIELDRYREIQHSGYLTLPEHTVDGAEPRLFEPSYWQHHPAGT